MLQILLTLQQTLRETTQGQGQVRSLFYFFLRFYLFIHDRHRETETETQAEGEAGSMQGARRTTRSQDPGVTPWAEGGTKPLSHPGCPIFFSYGLCF